MVSSAERAGVVGAGLVRRGISTVGTVVVGDRVVEVDGAAGGAGPGPVVPASDEMDLVAQRFRVLIGGVAHPVGEILDRLDFDHRAPQELGEPGNGHRPESLTCARRVADAEGGLVQVDAEHDLGCERGQVEPTKGVEEVGREGERARRRRRLGLVVVESGVGRWVVVRVGVLQEQGEELGGAREPAEGQGAELVGAGPGMPRRDDLAHPVDDRVDGGSVAGLEAGDQGAQAELIGAAQADVAPAPLRLAPLLVERGVGLDDLGLRDLEDPTDRLGRDHAGDRRVDDADPVESQVAESLAMRRATHTSQSPRRVTAQVRGRRCSRSRTSASKLAVAVTPAPRAKAISPRQKSCTPGVPSPPTCLQHVADASRDVTVRRLGRVAGVQRSPGREEVQLVHLGDPRGPLRLGRGGQQAGRVEVEEVGGHGTHASHRHRHSDPAARRGSRDWTTVSDDKRRAKSTRTPTPREGTGALSLDSES